MNAPERLPVRPPRVRCPNRKTFGVVAIALRHPKLFARLVARVERPLERLRQEEEL